MRAYTGSAKLAVMEAGVCSVLEQDVLTVKLDYSYYGKVQNMAEDGQFVIHRTGFEDVVILDLASQPEDTEKVRAALANLTGGQCRIEGCRRELVKVPEA